MKLQDEEDRALCDERLNWISSTSPGARGHAFVGVTSYALTADLACLASSESSSSYADLCCDESAAHEGSAKSQSHALSRAAAVTAATVARAPQASLQAACRHETSSDASRLYGHQPPCWPLADLLEILRYAALRTRRLGLLVGGPCGAGQQQCRLEQSACVRAGKSRKAPLSVHLQN